MRHQYNDLSQREKMIISIYRGMTELERMAVRLWMDTYDDSWLRDFDNDRIKVFCVLLKQTSNNSNAFGGDCNKG